MDANKRLGLYRYIAKKYDLPKYYYCIDYAFISENLDGPRFMICLNCYSSHHYYSELVFNNLKLNWEKCKDGGLIHKTTEQKVYNDFRYTSRDELSNALMLKYGDCFIYICYECMDIIRPFFDYCAFSDLVKLVKEGTNDYFDKAVKHSIISYLMLSDDYAERFIKELSPNIPLAIL